MKRIIELCFVVIVSLLIISCQKNISYRGEPANLYGGYERTNSFEKYNDFYDFYAATDTIKSKDTTGVSAPILYLSSEKVIFPTIDGSIISFYNYKTEWQYKLQKGTAVSAGMVADKNQNIYAVNNIGEIYSLSENGKLRWKINISDTSKEMIIFSDLLAVEDGVIAASSKGYIYKISENGKILWQLKSGLMPLKTFSADKEGNIYMPLTNNDLTKTDSLYIINKNGNIIKSIPFDNVRLISAPVIQKDNIFISGMKEFSQGDRVSVLYSLNKSGKINWSKEEMTIMKYISIADDGKIYAAGFGSGMSQQVTTIFCYDSKGKQQWRLYLEAMIKSPIMIDKKKIAFSASQKGASGIYFISKEGIVSKVLTVSNNQIYYLQPSVNPVGNITFPCADRPLLLRIDETPINKFIPW